MLSVIVVGRNDDFGGRFVDRLLSNAALNANEMSEMGVAYQYVFVEWNSPKGVGDLARLFVKKVSHSTAYVCGPELHAHVCDNPYMNICEFEAKNVAVRRAKTPWVLCTNADIIFDSGWLSQFRRSGLEKMDAKTLYRTAFRADVKNDVIFSSVADVERKENWLRDNPTIPPLYSMAAGDFQLASRAWWNALGGYDETIRFAKIHKDRRLCSQTLLLKGKVCARGRCFHVHHDDSYMTMKNRYSWVSHNGPEYNVNAGLPYRNGSDWGLAFCREEIMAPGVVRLVSPVLLRPKVPVRLVVPALYWKKGYEAKYGYPKNGGA